MVLEGIVVESATITHGRGYLLKDSFALSLCAFPQAAVNQLGTSRCDVLVKGMGRVVVSL